MNTIKIFLASSVNEFEQEINELGNYIQQLNGLYRPKGVFFELITSEEFEKSGQTEEEKAEIESSQYFYVIFGADAEESVVDDFDVALESFNEHDHPRVYTYFRRVPEGEKASERVEQFLQRLDEELGHYYSQFETIDSIKLNMILEIARNSDNSSNVKFEGGMLKLDGKDVISLENIPFYSRNEKLKEYIEKKKSLNEEFVKLADEYSKGNSEALIELSKIGSEKEKMGELICQIETDMYELYTSIIERTSSGEPITWRVREAGRRLEEGNYDAALMILRDEERENELKSAENAIDRNIDIIKGYMSENRLRIETLKSQGITVETIPEITECYKKNTDLAKKYDLDITEISGYISYLRYQKRYTDAIKEAEWLRNHVGELEDEDRAKALNDLALLYQNTQCLKEAEELFNKTIDIYRRLSERYPEVYEGNVAGVFNNLAGLYINIQRIEEAEKLYNEALDIFRRLSEKNPDGYESDVAMACNNLGVLYSKTRCFKEAEELYKEALDIDLKLSERDPEVYVSDVADDCNNLATLYSDTQRLEEAEKLYKIVLDIRRRLSERNPEAYESHKASSCYNLANLYRDTQRPKEAEELYKEAIDIYRRLAGLNLEVYENDVAMVCNNLAILYWNTQRIEEAERSFEEALDIYRRLAKYNPEEYKNGVADSCNNLANLYCKTQRLEEAEKLYKEALDIRRRLSERDSGV